MSTVYCLYRDTDRVLMYVGVSDNWASRFRRHSERHLWWMDVGEVHLEHYQTRQEALDREAELIWDCCPLYNVRGVRPSGFVARSLPPRLIPEPRKFDGTHLSKLRRIELPSLRQPTDEDIRQINYAGDLAFNRTYEREYRSDDPEYDRVAMAKARMAFGRAVQKKARELNLHIDMAEWTWQCSGGWQDSNSVETVAA